jgi:hypothetical protein
MSSTGAISLLEQRQGLRRRLREQRQVIALQLGPGPGIPGGYPRSRTMRFLTRQPALTVRLLVGLATLLVRR